MEISNLFKSPASHLAHPEPEADFEKELEEFIAPYGLNLKLMHIVGKTDAFDKSFFERTTLYRQLSEVELIKIESIGNMLHRLLANNRVDLAKAFYAVLSNRDNFSCHGIGWPEHWYNVVISNHWEPIMQPHL